MYYQKSLNLKKKKKIVEYKKIAKKTAFTAYEYNKSLYQSYRQLELINKNPVEIIPLFLFGLFGDFIPWYFSVSTTQLTQCLQL